MWWYLSVNLYAMMAELKRPINWAQQRNETFVQQGGHRSEFLRANNTPENTTKQQEKCSITEGSLFLFQFDIQNETAYITSNPSSPFVVSVTNQNKTGVH